jgi:hypothetical protein
MSDQNKVFALVDPEKARQDKIMRPNEKKPRYFQFFGLEDTVINHA